MYSVSGIKPIVVTRSNLVFGSLKIQSNVVTTHDPLLFVDCTLDEFRSEPTDRSNADIFLISCVFHTFPHSSSIPLLNCVDVKLKINITHFGYMLIESIQDNSIGFHAIKLVDDSSSNTDFPSLRRNVLCSNGKVSIEAVGGDGHSSPHHWISSRNCSVEKEDKILPAPFFVPTLSSTQSKSKLDLNTNQYEIVLKGETLIPCGLSLDVFERIALSKKTFSEGEHILVELDPSEVTSWKEDTIELSLHQSSLTSLNTKHDLHCRVLFGSSGKTDSFSLKGLKGNMSQAGRVVSIVVPIVCSVVLLLVFLIVMLVLVCRRQQKKQNEKQPKPVHELDECQIEVKQDDCDANSTIRPFFSTSDLTLHPHSLNMISNGGSQEQSQFSDCILIVRQAPQ
ncbi:hypothetical protein BLNAU_8706 [Blattamonas nauphoetae]|uniref:Uncharacterized protein n=1 Tax=Blattamonas nauphoetae TaxID=2049346 RepID=A0ABQ9XXY5_9EUKA|nr:hypothetical protein BLNAU_8706 [Blattamonas nauphoetae]